MELHKAHLPILKDLGLSETEALLYEVLLEEGPSGGAKVAQTAGVGRGNAYNALASLKKKGLVLEKAGKVAVFEAAPPSQLQVVVEREKNRIAEIATTLSATLPRLSSMHRLSTGKPAITYYEGIEGYRHALETILEASEEVRIYIDSGGLKGPFLELDEWFERSRISRNIPSRVIVADTSKNRQEFSAGAKMSETRFLSGFAEAFGIAMQITDSRIAYYTLTDEKNIAVIIDDPRISQMHSLHFEFLWRQAAAEAAAASGASKTK